MISGSLPRPSAFACVFPSVSHASMCTSEVCLSHLSTALQNTMTGQFMSARGKEHNQTFDRLLSFLGIWDGAGPSSVSDPGWDVLL